MQDAVYASGKWPAEIEHEPLQLNKARGETLLLRAEDYEIEKSNEVNRLMDTLRFRVAGDEQVEPEHVSQVEPKSGVAKFLPRLNPFKSATA